MIIVRKIEGEANYASRRAMAERIVSERFNCAIVRDDQGAPSIESGEARISISHTDRYVAIAAGDSQMGIDIELLARRVDHLAARFASADEISIATNAEPRNPSLLIWCAKEAIYKTMHRVGVDFLRDITIVDAHDFTIRAIADGRTIKLQWQIIEQNDNLLVVSTI